MTYIELAEKSLEKATRCQDDMQEAWRSSKPTLIEVYDKRANHCTNIALAYIKLELLNKGSINDTSIL